MAMRTAAVTDETGDEDTITRRLDICNERGLHARASARFVRTVESHDATVIVSKGDATVGGTSIMGLMMLAAAKGCTIEVSATGPDAEPCLDALADLLACRFGEEC